LKHFLCWNYVLQDCKYWLQQHGAATQTEVTYYIDSVHASLSHATDEHYKDTLPVAMTKCSHAFSQFFVDSIHPVVSQLGRWALQVYGLDQITDNQSRLVQLFPRLSCSCPAAGGCYHIAAANQAIGLTNGIQRKVLNLTQLRRNKQKRPDKTAGCKRPSTADTDVVTASDADPTLASAAVRDIDDAEAATGALDGNDGVEPLLTSDRTYVTLATPLNLQRVRTAGSTRLTG